MIDGNTFQEILRNLTARIKTVEVREDTGPGVVLVVALPTPAPLRKGRIRFVANARKVGEAPGAGTGTLAYDDGVAWRRASDDTTISA